MKNWLTSGGSVLPFVLMLMHEVRKVEVGLEMVCGVLWHSSW